jgi:predicted dithiol-disulfide oxidoreductase (DUF899 family)
MHNVRFPGESGDYRQARDELLKAELDLRRQVAAVAEQRRALPMGGEVPVDYEFEEWDEAVGAPRTVRLSELFEAGKDSLFLYSFMFRPGEHGPLDVPCPLCTSVISGVESSMADITNQINFAVVAKVPIERFRSHALARGWRNLRLLSSANTTYNRDYHAETPDEEQYAMATVFGRRDGKIHHHWSSELWFVPPEPDQNPRHVDFMWPLWAVLDRTPQGRKPDWWPELQYRRR